MGQSKEIRQNWTTSRNLDTCFVFVYCLAAINKYYFWKGDWGLGSSLNQLRDFPNIYELPEILRLKPFDNSGEKSYTKFIILGIEPRS